MEHGSERRRWPRFGREILAGVSAAIPAGPKAELLNLSSGGALLQVAGRLAPEVSLRLRLTKQGCPPVTIDGRVAWVRVANLADGQVLYHAGIRFDAPVTNADTLFLPDADARNDEAPVDASEPATAEVAAAVAPQELVETIERERRQWESERAATVAQLEHATVRADALQAKLDAQTHEHAEALVTVRMQFESAIADLVKLSQERQEECARLTERLTGIEDAQREDATKFETIIADLVKASQDKQEECERLVTRLASVEDAQGQDAAQFEGIIADLVKTSQEKLAECDQLTSALASAKEAQRADNAEFERIIDHLVRTLQQKEVESDALVQHLTAAEAAERQHNAELTEQVAFWTREAQTWERQVGEACRALQGQLTETAERRAAFEDRTGAAEREAGPVIVRVSPERPEGGSDGADSELSPVLAISA